MKGLKLKRKEAKLTQTQLAEKLNVTFKTVYNWEAGKTEPTFSTLKTLSKFFNCSIEELL